MKLFYVGVCIFVASISVGCPASRNTNTTVSLPTKTANLKVVDEKKLVVEQFAASKAAVNGDYVTATAHARKMLEMYPGNVEAMDLLQSYLMRTGENTEAKSLAEKVLGMPEKDEYGHETAPYKIAARITADAIGKKK